MEAATPETFLSRFGLASFRPGQRDVIAAVLDGADALCIMPTGGGKSLCYQLPALAREGITLVVSPLIALMKDQVDQLRNRGIPATYINSSLSGIEQGDRMQRMAAGEYSLVYIAPERLRNSRFHETLRAVKVSLLAIDEAHCISEWGHDFRPDYSRLGLLRKRLGSPQTIALTATATPDVREDILKQLELRQPRIFVSGFARPNLHFEVQAAYGKGDKEEQLLEFLRGHPDAAGLIYASTRKKCEEVRDFLQKELKRRVGFYHAGLLPDERRQVQDQFMSGRTPVLVATNAFGMGVDKADLRFVIHHDLPGSIEAYYQEAGRAGRDGLDSNCVLLFSESDRRLREFFIENAYPPRDVVETIYNYLRNLDDDPIEITQDELKDRLRLTTGAEAVSVSERLLEKAGALERLDARENLASVRINSDLPTLVDLIPSDAKVKRKVMRGVENLVGDIRQERVFFSPQKLARDLEMEPAALTRALKELNKLQSFDYLPPFRGRAIHMLERTKPFDELQIDFAELEERKQAEYARLDEMIAYARTRQCRQLQILEYFGDKSGKKCEQCDNCGGRSVKLPESKQPLAVDLSLNEGQNQALVAAARMALAGVARARGYAGKILIAAMLQGANNKNIIKRKFDKLSTFGRLKALTQPEIVQLLDALQGARLIDSSEQQKFRPVIKITAKGEQVMRQQIPLPPLHMSGQLLLKITAYVRPTADQIKPEAKVTSEQPLQDPHIAEVEDDDVLTEGDAGAFGDAEDDFDWARENADSLSMEFEETATVSEKPPEVTRPVSEGNPQPDIAPAVDSAARPNFYWTWLLLDRGYSIEDCLAIRQIDQATYQQHLIQAKHNGYAVRPEWQRPGGLS